MNLSPDDIVNYEFKSTWRGYEPEAVDALLDRIADQIEASQAELQDLRDRLADAEARVQETLETEGTLTRTLVAAQATAERTVADAQAQAQRTLEEAQEQAAEVRAAAERDAAEQLDQAQAEAAKAIADGQARREQLIASVAELRHVEQHHRQHLREHLEASLAMLDHVEPVPRSSELPGAPAPDAAGAALEAPTAAETRGGAGSSRDDAPSSEGHEAETAEAVAAASAEHLWSAGNVDEHDEPERAPGASASPSPSEPSTDPWKAPDEPSTTSPDDAEQPDDQPLFGDGDADGTGTSRSDDPAPGHAADAADGERPDLTVRVRDEP